MSKEMLTQVSGAMVQLLYEFERLGMVVKTGGSQDGQPIYDLTQFGKQFLEAHRTTDDFCKALDRKTAPKKGMSEELPVEQFLAIRKEEALNIDPDTAEVEWRYRQTLDPYGVGRDLPEECQQVGRAYFARSPGSDVWVWFGDLPEKVRDALFERHKSKLVFPAGLEFLTTKPPKTS